MYCVVCKVVHKHLLNTLRKLKNCLRLDKYLLMKKVSTDFI